MFADDCVLYKSGIEWKDIHEAMQRMLDEYIRWGFDHCLHLNAGKTKCMIVGNKGKVKSTFDPAPFKAGKSYLCYVKFAGISLDMLL